MTSTILGATVVAVVDGKLDSVTLDESTEAIGANRSLIDEEVLPTNIEAIKPKPITLLNHFTIPVCRLPYAIYLLETSGGKPPVEMGSSGSFFLA